MKICKKCNANLHESEFHKDSGLKSGLKRICKACNISNVSVWQKANPEKFKANKQRSEANNPGRSNEVRRLRIPTTESIAKKALRSAAYYLKNIEWIKESQKAWRQGNKARKSAAGARWHILNREKSNSIRKAWRLRNPGQSRKSNAARRSRIAGVGGSYSTLEIAHLLTLQKCKCIVCKASLKESYHIDHVTPISRGGVNSIENLQLLCPPCNLNKHAKDPIVFMQSKGFLL